MTRLFALTLSAALLASAAGRADDAEARAVVVKAVKAHGGEEYLTKNKGMQARNKGKIQLPGVGEVEFEQSVTMMLPDRLKETLDLVVAGRTVSVRTIVVGDKVSIESGGNAVEVTDTIKEALANARYMMAVGRLAPLLTDKAFELALVGEAKVGAKACVGVRVSKKGHKDVNLFFDKETGLLAKLEHRTLDPTTRAEITEERIILEYKKNADGVPLPKKVEVRHDGKAYIEAEVLEIKYSEKIDDAEFKK